MIKFSFQGRTKWKRKYTSDVETLASQYYAQIGIGGIARPMVVGDRLWLFSQTPNMPPQSLNIPASETTPMNSYGRASFGGSIQSSLPPPPPNTSAMQPTRMPGFPNRLGSCNFLGNDSTAASHYDFKPESFYRQFLGNPANAGINRFSKEYLNISDTYFSSNQPKALFNKFLWSNALANKPMDRPYDMFANRYSESDSHSDAIPPKDIGSSGGIAELERVFGSNIDQRPSHSLNNGPKFGNKLNNTTIPEISDCPSEENSDVDCEQL